MVESRTDLMVKILGDIHTPSFLYSALGAACSSQSPTRSTVSPPLCPRPLASPGSRRCACQEVARAGHSRPGPVLPRG